MNYLNDPTEPYLVVTSTETGSGTFYSLATESTAVNWAHDFPEDIVLSRTEN